MTPQKTAPIVKAAQIPRIVKRVQRLKLAGIFKDYSWPSSLPEFERTNIVFGWNGSGKSTLSRIFRAIEQQASIDAELCKLKLGGDVVDLTSEPRTELPPIRVFNRDYVDETVAADHFGSILVVTKDASKYRDRLDKLKRRISHLETAFGRITNDTRRAKKDVSNYLRDEAKKIAKEMLSLGQASYKTFNATKLKAAFEAKRDDALGTEDQATRWRETLSEGTFKSVPIQNAPWFDLPDLLRRCKEAVARNVVSTALATLTQNEALANWVQEGIGLHKEHGGADCLYCGNKVSEHREKQLAGHFSDEVDRLQADLESLRAELDQTLNGLSQAHEWMPDSSALMPVLRRSYLFQRSEFESTFEKTKKWLGVVRDAVEHRIRNPVKRHRIPARASESAPKFPNAGPIVDLIKKHNDTVQDLTATKAKAAKNLERFKVESRREAYLNLIERESEAAKVLELSGGVLNRKQSVEDDVERKVSEHRRPGEEVTAELHAYLGRCDLSLSVKASGYELHRGGHAAEASSLSEGEKTALALLYLLKSLEDREFAGKGGIVVVDDPVSSLDSNAMFSAVGFLRARLHDAGTIAQLFVLTHNFNFFSECRRWRNVKPQLYMLEATGEAENRSAALKAVDPMMTKYDSEYHYLFKRVAASANSESLRWEDAYPLPNVARRLIDAFLAFRVPTKEHFKDKLERAARDFAPHRIVRLERFLQLYSHADWVPVRDTDMSLLGSVHQATKDVCDFMEDSDPDHFAAMLESTGEAK